MSNQSKPARASRQLESIHAMLSSGHQSIRIEKHTFFYWGIAGGLLTALLEFLYRNVAMLMNTTIYVLLCASILGTIGYLDYRKTRNIRRSQDESLSFIQVRMTRIWWLLIGAAIAFNVGLGIYGGNIAFSMWFILIGLAIIIQSFFSTQPLMPFGIALIVIGAISPLCLPYTGLSWLAVSVFGVGIPLLGFMLYQTSGLWQADKPYAVIIWFVLAIAPGYAAYQADLLSRQAKVPTVTAISLAEYQANAALQQGSQIIRLPIGTIVPLKLSAKGSLIDDSISIELPLKLNKSIEVVLENGKLNGMYRVGQGEWSNISRRKILRINDLFIDINAKKGLNMDTQLGILPTQK